jgi:hypothetical protein
VIDGRRPVGARCERLEQAGHERGTAGHLVEDHVLVIGMCSVSHRSQPVERRDSQRRGAIAVGAAGDLGAFRLRQSEPIRDAPGQLEQRRGPRRFERRAAAEEHQLEPCTRVVRLQVV